MEQDRPEVCFARIRKKAEFLGLSDEHLASLNSISNLQVQTFNRKHFLTFQHYVCLAGKIIGPCIIIFLLILTAQWPFTRKQFLMYYWDFTELDMEKERCAINFHDFIGDLTRPPVDCSICKNIKEVDRVKKITAGEFEKHYAYTGRPVIIQDGTTNWTAANLFSFEFLKNIYKEDSPVLGDQPGDANCQFFPYKTNFQNLKEVFNMSKERAELKDGAEPWYIGWSNCDSAAANILRKHYERPYFLPKVAESSKTDWIFMGSPGYGAHMHIDNVLHPSWQAQITGSKKWTLEPPPECYYECPVSMIEVTVEPGEIIVLDTNRWFHATKIVSDVMSITIGSEYD